MNIMYEIDNMDNEIDHITVISHKDKILIKLQEQM
jgi:hypothetical protein